MTFRHISSEYTGHGQDYLVTDVSPLYYNLEFEQIFQTCTWQWIVVLTYVLSFAWVHKNSRGYFIRCLLMLILQISTLFLTLTRTVACHANISGISLDLGRICFFLSIGMMWSIKNFYLSFFYYSLGLEQTSSSPRLVYVCACVRRNLKWNEAQVQ